jgi:D-glycero-D-manno-heptose 1,7-bisphosphate phosphatase
MRRAAFLDRDGVVNVDRAYVHRWEDFAFVAGAPEAMRRLGDAGWQLVIVTNQSGIARGLYTEAAYQALTRRMLEALAAQGVQVLDVYHCPHHPAGQVPALAIDCDCRKPAPGLLLRAAREHDLDLAQSILVGDKPSDIEAARAAGLARAYRVRSDYGNASADDGPADATFDSLARCVDALVSTPRLPTTARSPR